MAVCRSLGNPLFCVALRALVIERRSLPPPGRAGPGCLWFLFASSFCAEAFSFGECGYFVTRVIVLRLPQSGIFSERSGIFLHPAVTAGHFRTETLRLLQSTAVTTGQANFLTYCGYRSPLRLPQVRPIFLHNCSCMLKISPIYNYALRLVSATDIGSSSRCC